MARPGVRPVVSNVLFLSLRAQSEFTADEMVMITGLFFRECVSLLILLWIVSLHEAPLNRVSPLEHSRPQV